MATKSSSSSKKDERSADRVVTSNRRALHEYHILDSIEAGIVLTGTEIKSIREGRISITEAYARIIDGELWLIGAHISPYSHGSYTNHDPDRPRKLLVRKPQIRELRAQIEQKGMTIVPLRIALRHGRAKVDIGIARGKKLWDKRDASSERDANREIARAMRDKE
ncbi:MAG: SsrA-binding protein SmpB [Thermomicrobiales bacterium]|nr:SsrA-binding protein SmpB [Thermomicrobiales bacterium]